MNSTRIFQIAGVFFTGMFTGLMFTFWVVIQRMLVLLSPAEYTRNMQGLIQGADHPPLVPMIVVFSMLAPAIVLVQLRQHKKSPVFRLTLAALVIFVFCVFAVTIGLNVPLNNAVMSWSPSSPPPNWMEVRDKWNGLSVIRTLASGLSFVLLLIAVSYPLPTQPDSK